MTTGRTRKQGRDQARQQDRRVTQRARRDLKLEWRELRKVEIEDPPTQPVRALAERRSVLEARSAELLTRQQASNGFAQRAMRTAKELGQPVDVRAHGAMLHAELVQLAAEAEQRTSKLRKLMKLQKQRSAGPRTFQALDAIELLDYGKAWWKRLGGGHAALQRIAGQLHGSTQGSAMKGIPEAAWAAALAQWKGWPHRPKGVNKGGRPKATVTVYRADQILAALLRAGGLTKCDAWSLRADVNAARSLMNESKDSQTP